MSSEMVPSQPKIPIIRGNKSEMAEIYATESDLVKKIDPDIIRQISFCLTKGLSSQDAAAAALVSSSSYDKWHAIGKNLYEGKYYPGAPDLIPLQPGEEETAYLERKQAYRDECDLYVDFFLLCNQAKQSLNESMLSVITEYAKQQRFDSWRAADVVITKTGGWSPPKEHHVKHTVEGDVNVSHNVPQINTLFENIAKSMGTANRGELIDPTIVEAEIVDEE